MTVRELIEHLKQFDGELPVAYELYSEYKLLEAIEIEIIKLHPHRPDGWAHNFWSQRDKENNERVPYLVFPGN